MSKLFLGSAYIKRVMSTITRRIYDEVELVARHMRVLRAVAENQPIGITRLSRILEMPPHEIRNSLSALEQATLIRATRKGAMLEDGTREKVLQIANELKELRDIVEIMRKEALDIVV